MKQINISFNSNENKYISIYKQIKNMIINGILKENESLPSRRDFASYLNVSTNTILNAYNLLLDEGYIVSKNKSGYFVSTRKYKTKTIEKEEIPHNVIQYKYDFTSSNVDKSIFPYFTFKKVTENIISNNPEIWLTKSPYQGNINLRKQLASYLYENKGMNVNENNIVIVSSLMESLEIISTLINIKSVGIENPTYNKVYSFFKKANKEINLLPIDDKGVVLEDKKKVDLLYVTPYNQFPMGVKMANSRKKELLDYPTSYIFEDDFDCDLINQNKIMSTIYSLDNTKVIYHGSFSHTLCGGLRISYLVLPQGLVSIYKNKYSSSSSRISSLDQELLSSFLKEGYYYRNLSKIKKSLNIKKEKIRAFLDTIESITYQESELSFIISGNFNVKTLKEKFQYEGLNISFVDDFLINSSDSRIILSYIGISVNDLDNGLIKFKNIIEKN